MGEKHKRAEAALRASEERYRSLVESTDDSIYTVNRDGKYLFANKKMLSVLGLPQQKVVGRHYSAFISGEPAKEFDVHVKQVFEYGKSVTYECRSKDDVWLLRTLSPIKDPETGEITAVTGITKSITEQKQAEDQLKTALKEKEVLLREIHHRVKNNLQVVSSLLNMQARTAKNKEAIDVLAESRNRINAMALIHSQLYENSDLSAIHMKGFVDKLLGQILQSYPVQDTKISSIVHVVDYPLPISIAVPLGLIVNELLSNAFKHAFVNRKEGEIVVVLRAAAEGLVSLTVSDDGVGLPERFDFKTSETLGLHVVKILVEEQLDGNLEVIRDNGTTFKIEFKLA